MPVPCQGCILQAYAQLSWQEAADSPKDHQPWARLFGNIFTTNWLSQWGKTRISQKRASHFVFDGWIQVLSHVKNLKFVESPSNLEELKTSFSFSLFVVFL